MHNKRIKEYKKKNALQNQERQLIQQLDHHKVKIGVQEDEEEEDDIKAYE